MDSHTRQRLLYAVSVRPKSLYEDVHASTGHPGYIGMRWGGDSVWSKSPVCDRVVQVEAHCH